MKIRVSVILAIFLFVISTISVRANEVLRVAAAANLLYPLQEIAKTFKSQTNTQISLIFNSSGKLLALIEMGAPFDVFFSADAKRPEILHQQGICSRPLTYTHGVLVLWSKDRNLCKAGWPWVLKSIKRLAIANPKLAPYGEVAIEVIKKSGLETETRPKLVTALTVSQAFQWAESGNTDAALVSFSLALSKSGQKGCYLRIPNARLIEQKVCIMNRSPQKELAKKFIDLVLSNKGQAILTKYGYKE